MTDALAIAAIVVSLFTLVVALFQALFQYFNSSSSRDKCTRAAIGPSASLVKFHSDFCWWRLRVHYPVISLRASCLLKQQVQLYKNSIKAFDDDLNTYVGEKGWGWYDVREYDERRWYQVA